MVHLATEQILAYAMKPGDVLSANDGNFTVVSADFGDPHKYGFHQLNGRTAAPWVAKVKDEAGREIEIVLHPRHLVTVAVG